MSEFSRVYDVRHLPDAPVTLHADPSERAALAQRFGLVRIDRLTAVVTLTAVTQGVRAEGRVDGAIIQSCAVSGEDLPMVIGEPLALRFTSVRPDSRGQQEIELDADQLDEIEIEGSQFDLGEAVAQTLALAIDPFATGPQADDARRKAGIVSEVRNNPFADLAGKLK